MHEFNTFTAALWTGLGAFGGVVKVLVQLLREDAPLRTKKNIMWLLLANSLVSGFSGFLGAVIMTQFTSNDNLHVIAAGIAGYMGVAALDIFSDWFRKKINEPPTYTP